MTACLAEAGLDTPARPDSRAVLQPSSGANHPVIPADPVQVVLNCHDRLRAKVAYTFDTLFMSAGIPVAYVAEASSDRPSIVYGGDSGRRADRCLTIAHSPEAWRFLDRVGIFDPSTVEDGVVAPFPMSGPMDLADATIPFDLAANAFYFLSCWSERVESPQGGTRKLFSDSVFDRFCIPQDIVDRYRALLLRELALVGVVRPEYSMALPPPFADKTFAVVLSHDVDFVANGLGSTLEQAARTFARHLVRQRDPQAAALGISRLLKRLARGQDVFCPLAEIVAREESRGVTSSFQVAVERRHPSDVNYDITDHRVREWLEVVTTHNFDLCLHGSFLSTNSADSYVAEVERLAAQLARPLGSRQHFLSFDFAVLFSAQERAGIEYDMSLGFPDRIGPRAGFSHPFFPYCLEEDRPYDVLQIGLFLMDVTLRSYMGLRAAEARARVDAALADLRHKRGCASVVWHPIVFGGARDPGYDDLYWHLVDRVLEMGGLATDGRKVNAAWRRHARRYETFRNIRGEAA